MEDITYPSENRVLTAGGITLYPRDLKEQFEVNYDARPLLAVSKEMNSEDKWMDLYKLDKQAGELYSSKCIPTPVFIKGSAEPMHDGLFGWASVVFHDLNHEFIDWLKNNSLGNSYEDYYLLSINVKGRYEQSVAFAEGFCKVLRANNINCKIEKYLD